MGILVADSEYTFQIEVNLRNRIYELEPSFYIKIYREVVASATLITSIIVGLMLIK